MLRVFSVVGSGGIAAAVFDIIYRVCVWNHTRNTGKGLPLNVTTLFISHCAHLCHVLEALPTPYQSQVSSLHLDRK